MSTILEAVIPQVSEEKKKRILSEFDALLNGDFKGKWCDSSEIADHLYVYPVFVKLDEAGIKSGSSLFKRKEVGISVVENEDLPKLLETLCSAQDEARKQTDLVGLLPQLDLNIRFIKLVLKNKCKLEMVW